MRQSLKPSFQFGACCLVIKAPVLHRQLPYFFNRIKYRQTLLLGDDFTQQSTQQANVVAQLLVLVILIHAVAHNPSSDHNELARNAMAVADEGP